MAALNETMYSTSVLPMKTRLLLYIVTNPLFYVLWCVRKMPQHEMSLYLLYRYMHFSGGASAALCDLVLPLLYPPNYRPSRSIHTNIISNNLVTTQRDGIKKRPPVVPCS